MEALRGHLGPRFNADLESIYSRAFEYLVGQLERTFDKEAPSAPAATASASDSERTFSDSHESDSRKELSLLPQGSHMSESGAAQGPHGGHMSESGAAQCPVLKQNSSPGNGTESAPLEAASHLNESHTNVNAEETAAPPCKPSRIMKGMCCTSGYSCPSPEVRVQAATGGNGGPRSLLLDDRDTAIKWEVCKD